MINIGGGSQKQDDSNGHGLFESSDISVSNKAHAAKEEGTLDVAIEAYLLGHPLKEIHLERSERDDQVHQLELRVTVTDATGKDVAFLYRMTGLIAAQTAGLGYVTQRKSEDE